jgi:thiaminase
MAKKQGASNDEQVGFHKGALATLAKEREEMQKILSIVEQLMQMHIKALKELGVDLEKAAKEAIEKAKETKKTAGKKKKIEEML